ncbi:MAG: hypothetical protein CACLOHII_00243 [Candidatus Westeberhardia cardiocondylae]|nr:hypothetical protein [Candidatus Westeberhardia cardiocondylae]
MIQLKFYTFITLMLLNKDIYPVNFTHEQKTNLHNITIKKYDGKIEKKFFYYINYNKKNIIKNNKNIKLNNIYILMLKKNIYDTQKKTKNVKYIYEIKYLTLYNKKHYNTLNIYNNKINKNTSKYFNNLYIYIKEFKKQHKKNNNLTNKKINIYQKQKANNFFLRKNWIEIFFLQ